jgi:hypothetical protein
VCLENCNNEHSTLTVSLPIVNAIRQGPGPGTLQKIYSKDGEPL